MPIAAKLMIRLEPPAETNGSGMPVTGMSPTTTADVDERLEADPGRDPRREHRAEGVRRARGEVRIPRYPMARNRTITSPAAQQPELLADDREDEVVEGVGQEQAAGEPALAEARAEDPAERQGEVALDAVEPDAGRRRSRGPARP